jgi:Flp pilus assembly protein TadD
MSNSPDYQEEVAVIVTLLKQKTFNESYNLILDLLRKYPNEPWAHNLLGCWFEMQGEVILAMKHYRAAYALSPAYDASRMNVIEFQMQTRSVNQIYF